MQNATRKARTEGEKLISAKDIRKVTLVSGPPSLESRRVLKVSKSSLRRFKG